MEWCGWLAKAAKGWRAAQEGLGAGWLEKASALGGIGWVPHAFGGGSADGSAVVVTPRSVPLNCAQVCPFAHLCQSLNLTSDIKKKFEFNAKARANCDLFFDTTKKSGGLFKAVYFLILWGEKGVEITSYIGLLINI